MQEGDIVKLVDGAFKGLEGTVLFVERDDVTVRLSIFGRETDVVVKAHHIHDPDRDPRDNYREQIQKSIENWWRHLEMTWWQSNDAPTWSQYKQARDQMLSEKSAEIERLNTDFEATFTNAVFDDQGAPALHALWDNDVKKWLLYKYQWMDIVAERRKKVDKDRDYVNVLEGARIDGESKRLKAFMDDFDTRHPINEAETKQRRDNALKTAMARYEAIKPKFETAFKLKLPKQTAVYYAFWTSLDAIEREAADFVWRYPAGIMDWFVEGFEDKEPKDGLDARLHYRYRSAPPEFVCVMTGDSDGLNYGLVYDDPAVEPELVAGFYARDDPTVFLCDKTILGAYRDVLERVDEDLKYDSGLSEDELLEYRAKFARLRDAVMYFDTNDRPEIGSAYSEKYNIWVGMFERVQTKDGLGVATDAVIPLTDRPTDGYALHSLMKENQDLVWQWVDEANDALDDGNPWPALVVGRDMFACDWIDEYQETAVMLMGKAYRALGRDALAEIAELHHKHRDLRSVDVY